MAFLEQIARGKCVIAHNDATMNEYITDGQSGIIRNFNAPQKKISAAEIQTIHPNVRALAGNLYARWLQERDAILPFCESTATLSSAHCGGLADIIRYCAFLLEGSAMRLTSRKLV